jgi:hypothetical protein
MPIRAVPPHYNPDLSNALDMRVIEPLTAQLAGLEAEYARRSSRLNDDLKAILSRFIDKFNEDPAKRVPMHADGEPIYPLVNLLNLLHRYMDSVGSLSPEQVVNNIKLYCLDPLIGNSLSSGIELDEFLPVVYKANAHGERLQHEFKPFIAEIKALSLAPLAEEIQKTRARLRAFDVKPAALAKVWEAFRAALSAINDLAAASSADGAWHIGFVAREFDNYASQRRLCEITVERLNTRVDSQSAFARQYRGLLNQIIEAHIANIAEITSAGFTLPTVSATAAAPAPAPVRTTHLKTAAPAPAPLTARHRQAEFPTQAAAPILSAAEPKRSKPSSQQALIEKLDTYLNSRSKIVGSSKTTVEYLYGRLFSCFQKSFTQKSEAVNALKDALNGEVVDLKSHVSTLRNGHLGCELRAFIKAGKANEIVGKQVNTVREFIAALDNKIHQPTLKQQ